MALVRTWLLPTALVGGQLLLWPGLPVLRGTTPEPWRLVAVVVAAVVVGGALGWRRRAPVPALVVVLAAQATGLLAINADELWLLVVAELVALFSVGVWAPGRITWLAVAGATGCAAVVGLVRFGPGPTWLGEVVLALLGYLIAAELGRSRRRWLARRSTVAERLVAAEGELRRAAEEERHRLARELHDVSAHHLTSIVVTVGAAERLAARRPDLVAEAVSFAATTSRDTLTALHRLVAVMRDGDRDADRPLAARLEELAAGFRRLDQPVTLDVRADLPAGLAEPVYALAREALTNVLRHARGARVRVRVAVEGATAVLEVTDDGAGHAAPVTLGAGRGIVGMRERAAALGGTLTAGPDGPGWRVRAVLPLGGAGAPVPPAGESSRRSLLTASLVAAATAVPIALAVVSAETEPLVVELAEPGTLAVIALLCAVHAMPLLLRRDRPWLALAGVGAAMALWPLAALWGGLPTNASLVLFTAGVAEFAAVYAIGAYAGRPAVSWLGAPLAAVGLAVGLVGTAAADGSLGGGPVDVPGAVVLGLMVAVLLTGPLLFTWGVGAVLRGRRGQVLSREDDALAAAAAQAVVAAAAERARIADGLRDAVLDRAGRLVAVTDAGRPADILVEARATLAAMRELLEELRPATPAQSAPLPAGQDAAGSGRAEEVPA
ncbi:histidine kinase [Micromonospora fluostatini]|uniref:histidine kinase n=1 Tax=Micromonospora fluostatini TaxID=1629071 RepID=A0ABY2DP95_9ACTN|nr:histidine kinase [Micromonospora fluostatini]